MSVDDMIKLYWKVVFILLIVVLGTVLMLFLMRPREKDLGKQEETATENFSEESLSETGQGAESESKENENLFVQDAVLEIDNLVKQFFQARFDCDIETLQQIVRPIDGYSEERLYRERYGNEENGLLEIERYEVKSCYSKLGLKAETYFVWVLTDVCYVNAETPAPALFRIYVNKDENGYYIYNGTLEEEEQAYLDTISAMEDIQELIDKVNQRFQEAVEQDEQLRNLVLTMEEIHQEETQSLEESQAE